MKTIAIAILAALLLAAGTSSGSCPPNRASRIKIWYEPAGPNTEVLLYSFCGVPNVSEIYEVWYVSYFEGHEQPDLWTYAEIQNTASRLIRGR